MWYDRQNAFTKGKAFGFTQKRDVLDQGTQAQTD